MNWLYPLLLLVGFFLGVFVTLCLTERVLKERRELTQRVYRNMLAYRTAFWESEARRLSKTDGDDADWWKK